MAKRDIAVTIQNLVQFYSIKAGLDELIKRNYIVDIYVPTNNSLPDWNNMFDETYNKLIQLGYSPIRNYDNSILYKILMEPYPMDIYYKFNFEYRIKYKYSPISAKPNLTLTPENNIYYDCILCYGQYEADYLSAYSYTKLIDNLKYLDYQKAIVKTNKTVLLYLPTFGDTSSIDTVIDYLKPLKKDYYIITKSHHGTSFLNDETSRLQKLKSISDEFYDHTISLKDLLEKSQLVLSDNSGSIFEAIYSNTPVAVFCENPNKNKINNFDTTQYKLIQKGYIPYTNNPEEISNILKKALSHDIVEKQQNLSKSLFFHSENPIENFVSIIESFLFDKINKDYKNMHDVIINNYNSKIELISNQNIEISTLNKINAQKGQEISFLKDSLSLKTDEINSLNAKANHLEDEINNLNNTIKKLKNKHLEMENTILYLNKSLSYYQTGKLYRLSNKAYKLYHRIIGKKE